MGSKALLIQQKAINVTGNNIANVNTPGYSRQQLQIEVNTPLYSSIGPLGDGVRATGVERKYDRFLGAQIINESQDMGRWEAQKSGLKRAEIVLNEAGGYGLNHALSEFWATWQDLSNAPENNSVRAVLVSKSEFLADTFNRTYGDLQQAQKDIDEGILGTIEDINRVTEDIAILNEKIMATETTGVNANDYRDSRDLLLKELSKMIQINTFEDSNGLINVSLMDGKPLVEASSAWDLTTQLNASGLRDILWVNSDGSTTDITSSIDGGELKGYLTTRDTLIAGYMDDMDDLAQSIMNEVNSLHRGGYGLDGTTGLDFFSGSVSTVMDSALTIYAADGSTSNFTITLVGGGTQGSENVTTDPATGNITVAIEDGVSTYDDIATALEAHANIDAVTYAAGAGATAWTLGAGTDTATITGSTAAVRMEVNAAIVGDFNKIAAAEGYTTVPGDKPGDNRNAIAIANLQHGLTMNSGTGTFDEYYHALVSEVGHDVEQASLYFDHQSDMMVFMENYRETVSGVSIDEEMVNLVKYQNAYEAAAKVITTADELLETVMSMIR